MPATTLDFESGKVEKRNNSKGKVEIWGQCRHCSVLDFICATQHCSYSDFCLFRHVLFWNIETSQVFLFPMCVWLAISPLNICFNCLVRCIGFRGSNWIPMQTRWKRNSKVCFWKNWRHSRPRYFCADCRNLPWSCRREPPSPITHIGTGIHPPSKINRCRHSVS